MIEKSVSILGYFGHTNTGDEAILSCMLTHLRQILPKMGIVVFSGDPVHTRRAHEVKAVQAYLPTSLTSLTLRILRGKIASLYCSLRAFGKMDTLIVGGGGLFFDVPGYDRFLMDMLFKINSAKKLGKRVILLGVGVGPIHLERSMIKLKNILNKVDLITVRDEDSNKLLNQLGVLTPPVYTTADLAFLLKSASRERVSEIMHVEKLEENGGPRIGVCLRSDHANIPGLKKAVIALCEYAINRLNAQIWFIPMQTGGGFDDRIGARLIINEFQRRDRIFLIEGSYTPEENMGLIGRTDVMIGERLHAIILSLNNCIPFLGISYMPKVERLFSEIGHREWQINLAEISADILLKSFDRIWEERNQTKSKLGRIHDVMQKKALSNFSLLAKAIET